MGSWRECTRVLGLEGFRVETIKWDGERPSAGFGSLSNDESSSRRAKERERRHRDMALPDGN